MPDPYAKAPGAVDIRKLRIQGDVNLFTFITMYWEIVEDAAYFEATDDQRAFWVVRIRQPSFEFIERLRVPQDRLASTLGPPPGLFPSPNDLAKPAT